MSQEKESNEQLTEQKNNNKDDSSSSGVSIFFAIIVAIIAGYYTYKYFENSLWFIFNLPFSLIIAFLVGLSSFMIFLGLFSYKKDKGNLFGSLVGVLSLAMPLILFFIVHYNFYKSDEEITQERQHELHMKQIEEEEIIQDRLETKKFLDSNQEIEIYGKMGESESRLYLWRAEDFIEERAHDPDSVQDVHAITSLVSARVRDFPKCRSILGVSFRAKNKLGALVRQEMYILFDYNGYPFFGIQQSPF